ncbi:MAG TPA: ABC transporter substrate-binding protein [Caldilineaceae bacterium]|nr:ABC transporter substrate-binding protein [Caldilineaceae bacterium]
MSEKFSRRRFLQVAGLTAGATMWAACVAPTAPQAGAGAAEGGGAAAPAGEAKVLEAWSRMTGLAEESMRGIIDNYNASNTLGNRVEFVYIAQTQGSQADEKLLTAVAGGNPPPLYYADRFTVPQFAHQGFFSEITDYAEAAGVREEDYYPFAWAETVYKGGIYALSFDTDTRALWYNKDIMAEAGVDPEKPPTNLDELRALTEALTVRDSNGRITRYGFNPIYDQAWLYTWGFAFQGEFQDPETKRITFAHPNNVRAAEFVKSFVDEIGIEEIDAFLAACTGTACNDANDFFWTGQTSMTCSGNWKVAQAHRYKPDTNYGVVPFPGPDGPAPYASWAGGWSWAIPMGTTDMDSAFDAISYFCGPEGQLKYNKDTYHIPTNIKASEDPFFREDPLHAVFMDLLPVSHTRPPIPLGSKLWDMQFKAHRDEIPHGLKTPEQALLDIDNTINAELEEIGFFEG